MLFLSSRNAKKKQILKAYRDLAKIWHPDKYEGDDKKKAEKMFIDLASAKEVLTDKGLYFSLLVSCLCNSVIVGGEK